MNHFIALFAAISSIAATANAQTDPANPNILFVQTGMGFIAVDTTIVTLQTAEAESGPPYSTSCCTIQRRQYAPAIERSMKRAPDAVRARNLMAGRFITQSAYKDGYSFSLDNLFFSCLRDHIRP